VALRAAVSIAVELVQGVGGGTHDCTSGDVIANPSGTAMDVAIASLVLAGLAHRPGR
jgi:hypothetical protein